MAQYEITYTRGYRQFARTVEADSFRAAEAACAPGEFVSGLILAVFVEPDSLAENMRARVGEALREVANG